MNKGRCQQAMKLISQRYWNTLDISFNEIAKRCHLAKSSVKSMAKVYRKEQEKDYEGVN